MKKYLVILLALVMFAGDISAKSFGGGSSRSSFGGSRSSFGGGSSKPSGGSSWFSSSKPSSKPSTPTPAPAYKAPAPTPAPTPAFQTNKSAPSTFGKPAVVAGAVATGSVVAVASTPSKPNAIDNKMTQQSATAGKTFQSKADAESAYRQKLASQSTYTTSTPPKSRPDYVPSNVNVGGRNTNVIYHSYPNGGYGYGYTDPVTHMFVALAATQMIVNANRQAEMNQMYNAQLAQQNAMIAQQNAIAHQQVPVYVPPVKPQSSGHGFFFYFFIIVAVFACIVIVIKVSRD